MFDFIRGPSQVQVHVQSLHEKPGKRSQHGVVHDCCRRHTRTVDLKVGNALIHHEGQVQNEHGHEQVHQDLSCLACRTFSVEFTSVRQQKL